MPPTMTETEFEALLARAGIPLSAAQKAGIYPVLGGLEAMQSLIRTPLPEATAEPATTFSVKSGSAKSGSAESGR